MKVNVVTIPPLHPRRGFFLSREVRTTAVMCTQPLSLVIQDVLLFSCQRVETLLVMDNSEEKGAGRNERAYPLGRLPPPYCPPVPCSAKRSIKKCRRRLQTDRLKRHPAASTVESTLYLGNSGKFGRSLSVAKRRK